MKAKFNQFLQENSAFLNGFISVTGNSGSEQIQLHYQKLSQKAGATNSSNVDPIILSKENSELFMEFLGFSEFLDFSESDADKKNRALLGYMLLIIKGEVELDKADAYYQQISKDLHRTYQVDIKEGKRQYAYDASTAKYVVQGQLDGRIYFLYLKIFKVFAHQDKSYTIGYISEGVYLNLILLKVIPADANPAEYLGKSLLITLNPAVHPFSAGCKYSFKVLNYSQVLELSQSPQQNQELFPDVSAGKIKFIFSKYLVDLENYKKEREVKIKSSFSIYLGDLKKHKVRITASEEKPPVINDWMACSTLKLAEKNIQKSGILIIYEHDPKKVSVSIKGLIIDLNLIKNVDECIKELTEVSDALAINLEIYIRDSSELNFPQGCLQENMQNPDFKYTKGDVSLIEQIEKIKGKVLEKLQAKNKARLKEFFDVEKKDEVFILKLKHTAIEIKFKADDYNTILNFQTKDIISIFNLCTMNINTIHKLLLSKNTAYCKDITKDMKRAVKIDNNFPGASFDINFIRNYMQGQLDFSLFFQNLIPHNSLTFRGDEASVTCKITEALYIYLQSRGVVEPEKTFLDYQGKDVTFSGNIQQDWASKDFKISIKITGEELKDYVPFKDIGNHQPRYSKTGVKIKFDSVIEGTTNNPKYSVQPTEVTFTEDFFTTNILKSEKEQTEDEIKENDKSDSSTKKSLEVYRYNYDAVHDIYDTLIKQTTIKTITVPLHNDKISTIENEFKKTSASSTSRRFEKKDKSPLNSEDFLLILETFAPGFKEHKEQKEISTKPPASPVPDLPDSGLPDSPASGLPASSASGLTVPDLTASDLPDSGLTASPVSSASRDWKKIISFSLMVLLLIAMVISGPLIKTVPALSELLNISSDFLNSSQSALFWLTLLFIIPFVWTLLEIFNSAKLDKEIINLGVDHPPSSSVISPKKGYIINNGVITITDNSLKYLDTVFKFKKDGTNLHITVKDAVSAGGYFDVLNFLFSDCTTFTVNGKQLDLQADNPEEEFIGACRAISVEEKADSVQQATSEVLRTIINDIGRSSVGAATKNVKLPLAFVSKYVQGNFSHSKILKIQQGKDISCIFEDASIGAFALDEGMNSLEFQEEDNKAQEVGTDNQQGDTYKKYLLTYAPYGSNDIQSKIVKLPKDIKTDAFKKAFETAANAFYEEKNEEAQQNVSQDVTVYLEIKIDPKVQKEQSSSEDEHKVGDQVSDQDEVISQDKKISQGMVLVIPAGQEDQAKELIKQLFYTDLVHPANGGVLVGYIKQIKIGNNDTFDIEYDNLFPSYSEERFNAILETSKELMNNIKNDKDIKDIMRKINEKSIGEHLSEFQDQSGIAKPNLSEALLSHLMSFVENNNKSTMEAIESKLNLIIHAAAARHMLIDKIDNLQINKLDFGA